MRKHPWYWNARMGPWMIWGCWWKHRMFIGVSIIDKGENWTE